MSEKRQEGLSRGRGKRLARLRARLSYAEELRGKHAGTIASWVSRVVGDDVTKMEDEDLVDKLCARLDDLLALDGSIAEPFSDMAARALVWAAVTVALTVSLPDLFAPRPVRVVEPLRVAGAPYEPGQIPRDGLPEQRLVTTFEDLQALGLFDRDLVPAHTPWSSGFFPTWFGREAGRWHDARLTLIWRTLTGMEPPTAEAARTWRTPESSDGLSPIEKYDLLVDDLGFAATREALRTSLDHEGFFSAGEPREVEQHGHLVLTCFGRLEHGKPHWQTDLERFMTVIALHPVKAFVFCNRLYEHNFYLPQRHREIQGKFKAK